MPIGLIHCIIRVVIAVCLLQCVPFWPTQIDKETAMIVKVKDDSKTSEPFSFVKPHTTLLKLDNKVGQLNIRALRAVYSLMA